MTRHTCNGTPGMTAEYYRRRDEVNPWRNNRIVVPTLIELGRKVLAGNASEVERRRWRGALASMPDHAALFVIDQAAPPPAPNVRRRTIHVDLSADRPLYTEAEVRQIVRDEVLALVEEARR